MTEATPQIEGLPKRESNPLRWPILQAGEDIEATFVTRLELLKPQEIDDLIKNTHYLFLPGQAFLVGLQAARKASPENPYVRDSGLTPGEVKFIEITRGLVLSLIAGGFRDTVLNKAYLSLLPPLASLLLVSAAPPERTIYGLSILQILTALNLPYALYHEMLHSISDKFFTDKYERRFNETLTDFWVREVTSRRNNSLARYATSYAQLPITAVLGWPSTFARRKIDRVVDLITERVRGRKEALYLLGSAYTGRGQNPNLIETFDKFTKGRGERLIEILNTGGSEGKKITEIDFLFNS